MKYVPHVPLQTRIDPVLSLASVYHRLSSTVMLVRQGYMSIYIISPPRLPPLVSLASILRAGCFLVYHEQDPYQSLVVCRV